MRIVTDIPGYTSCVVAEPVYSFNGRRMLVPKGSRILGRYDSDATGPRVAVVWDRITTPTGIDINMASPGVDGLRSEEHTSELQSLMRISYAVFCLKKKKHNKKQEIIKT